MDCCEGGIELPWILNDKIYRLKFQYVKYTGLLGWEPEVLRIRDYAQRGIALDVGANMGLWSYAMAKSGLFNQIIAFEPNLTLLADLENACLKNVRIVNKAVSHEEGVARLKIPRQGKMLLSGWASLENKIDLDVDDIHEIDVETIRLDDLNLVDVGFVKIDVEGHELSVLKGGYKLFFDSGPACIIECRDRNRCEVEKFFADLGVGYRSVNTLAEFGFDLSPGNMLFLAR